jgi:acyl-CoA reductase-like NAD-dependent aldehyde dehydrogenase
MSLDKTVGRFTQRHLNRPGAPAPQRSQGSATRRSNKPDRARQSLHFAHKTVKDLDEAYRKAEHDAYPTKLNKANFIEALIAYGIEHADEVVKLALEQQAEEDDEE